MVQFEACVAAEVSDLLRGEGCWSPDLEGPITDTELAAVERELRVELPHSYREFMRLTGLARVGAHEVFGLPRDGLWGDIVLMNHLAGPALPPGYVRFSRDRSGRVYCFDTGRMNAESECPVVLLDGSLEGTRVAPCFLDFLRRAACGEL